MPNTVTNAGALWAPPTPATKMAAVKLKPAKAPALPAVPPPGFGMSQSGGLGLARGRQPTAMVAAAPSAKTTIVPISHMGASAPPHGIIARSPKSTHGRDR